MDYLPPNTKRHYLNKRTNRPLCGRGGKVQIYYADRLSHPDMCRACIANYEGESVDYSDARQIIDKLKGKELEP